MRSSFIEPLEARIAPAAVISVTPAVDEGDSTALKQITVSLDTAQTTDVTIHYKILEGTAHFGDQFSLADNTTDTGTLVIAANTTSSSFNVVINGNVTANSDSNFQIQIIDATAGVTVPTSALPVAIWDDDRTVDFSMDSQNQSVNEGNLATPGHFDYTATLSAAADHDIVVFFKTQDHGTNYGDATTVGGAADYNAVTATFTFVKGTTVPVVSAVTPVVTGVTPPTDKVVVTMNGDDLPGPNELFNATLSKPSATAAFGAKLGTQDSATISTLSTIKNDDDGSLVPALTVSLGADVHTTEGGNATFGLVLSRLSESDVVVTYHTADGDAMTATAGMDYESALAGIKVAGGTLQDTIPIKALTDTHVEGAEQFKLILDSASVNNASVLGTKTSAVGTIDADTLPQLIFVKSGATGAANGDVTVIESSASTARTADFMVKLAYPDGRAFDLTQSASFDYTTMDGTGPNGASSGTDGDFTQTAGSHTFAVGTTEATDAFKISVPIKSDTAANEGNETFTLKLTGVQGFATIGDDTALGTIVDSTVVLKVSDVTVTEGNQGSTTAIVTILPGHAIPTGYDLLVDYSTVDNTAIGATDAMTHSPQDYVPAAGSLRFAQGTTFQTVGITVNGDTVIEGNENFNLHLSNARLVPTGTSAGDVVNLAGAADGGKTDGIITIVDDDGHAISASITADAATQSEGLATDKAHFTVHLSQAYSFPIVVHYDVTQPDANGTLVTKSVPFTIDAYTKDAPLSIDYVHDQLVGHDQNITVTLTSLTTTGTGVSLAPLVTGKTAKTTILEDDFYVQIVDNSALEGDTGTSLLGLKVQLTDLNGVALLAGHGLDHAVSVPFSTLDGTGTYGATSTGAGADFLARSATLTFAAGDVEKSADITIKGDTNAGVPDTAAQPTNPMGNEMFTVTLGTPSAGTVRPGHGTATATILNDDGVVQPTVTLTPVAPGVEADNAHGIAGSPATFQVNLSGGSEQPVTFEYFTSVLTDAQRTDLAIQDDFTAVPAGTAASIASGTTAATLSVSVTADGVNENAEHFGFNVTNIHGAANLPTATLTTEGTIAASNQPTITVANVSGVEGDTGTSNLTFIVKLSEATTKDVMFNVQTLASPGTATAGNDYVPLASTPVTIHAGETQATQTVTINGDTLAGEGNETFTFRVDHVVNAQPGVIDATGTILNDDAVFTITPAATFSEHDGLATLTVTRTGDVNSVADVSYQLVAGTAVSTGAFPDFKGTTNATGVVQFKAGATTASITVPLIDDDRHEASESFSVKLTDTSNGILGAVKTSVITITDDDAVPTATLVSPVAVVEKDSGQTAVTFTVNLDRANEADDIVLKYSTENLSAVSGQDYVGVTDQTLTIPKGATSGTFTIQVINDTTLDLLKTESFKVNVFPDPAVTGAARVHFANGASSLTGTASIIDNDVAPQISIAGGSYDEGSGNNFTISLNHASDKAVTVKYYTVNGTAVAGTDFTGTTMAAATLVTFAPGEITKTISVATIDDMLVEGNETLKVQLISPVGATLSKTAAVATGTILDNDHAYLSINDVTLKEGDNGTQDAVFTVTLLGDTAAPFTFNYATADNAPNPDGTANPLNALAGSDYIAKSGTLTLGGVNGAHTAQIVVKVIGDLIKESNDETFNVNLTGSTVATLTKATGIGTIQNDLDSAVTLSVSSQTLAEGSPSVDANGQTVSGDKTMTFTATLSQAATTDVTFHVKASEILKAANVARLGTDFVAPADVVYTIAAGQTQTTFNVTIKADQTFETTEFFNVTLTNITGALPGHAVGTGTIYDDDVYASPLLVKWTDVDGDLVSLSVNKGNLLTPGLFGFDNTSANAGTMGGRILQVLDLVSQSGLTFNHGNLSIVSTQQPNAAGVLTGDGRVNVGFIRANTYDTSPTLLELKGIDLANVAIDGDLSRINVGDIFSDPALGLLSTYSIGLKSSSTEAVAAGSTFQGPAESHIVAGATAIKVTTDISGVLTATGGAYGKIGTLTVGGALRGTADDLSALIRTTGAIGKATFHDIIGGAGKHSASITQVDTTASLGSLVVTGNITAGTGVESASVLFPTIGSVSIGGNLTGGATGGGFISATGTLGTVTIGGNFDGGARLFGGGLNGVTAINSVLVHGNVNSAQIKAGYRASISDTFTTLAAQEEKISADAVVNSVEVDGSVYRFDLLAGADPAATTNTFAQNSATLSSKIAKVVFNGAILVNPEAHYVSAQSIGSILVQGAARTGSITGTEIVEGTNFIAKYAI